MLCILRCLGRTIEGTGLDEAWQEADLYSTATVSQIIHGNHYNRAIEAHQITLQKLHARESYHVQISEIQCKAPPVSVGTFMMGTWRNKITSSVYQM